ncbi:hypothetical protein F5884DRAFT_856128 [Xylogone sp. PMI_703]|nr:hypothetical protein F5884DRAFT_856128 [Xylogone sp. PMI_703]
MDYQEEIVNLPDHLLPTCRPSCLVASQLALLEESLQHLRLLTLHQSERIHQLEEKCAWFTSQMENIPSVIVDADFAQFCASHNTINNLDQQPTLTDSYRWNSNFESLGLQSGSMIHQSHTFCTDVDGFNTTSDCLPLPSNDIRDQIFEGDMLGTEEREVAIFNLQVPHEGFPDYQSYVGFTDTHAIAPVPIFQLPTDAEIQNESSVSYPEDQQLLAHPKVDDKLHYAPLQTNIPNELAFTINGELLRPIIQASSDINDGLPKRKLDRYILFLGSILQQFFPVYGTKKTILESVAAEGMLWIVREAWPDVERFWKMTASFDGFFQYELWRNFPCRETYNMLRPTLRPTRTQLQVPHSPVIDWLPWPDFRDLVIRYQDEVDIDIICKTVIENGVSYRRLTTNHSQNISHSTYPQQLEGISSFRIWDIYCLEEQSAGGFTSKLSSTSLMYKARSAPVVALEKAYNLVYNDVEVAKLHQNFFDKYPFLYRESVASRYRIQELPTVETKALGYPGDLSCGAMKRLEELVKKGL